MQRRLALLLFLGLELLLVSALGSRSWANPPGVYPPEADLQQLPDGAWTWVVFPDTQYYVDHTRVIPPSPEIFQSMVDWTISQRDSRRVRLVLHVGDIVDNDTVPEWTMAKRILSRFDGQLPYAFALGNHDYAENASRRETRANSFLRSTDNPLNDPQQGGILLETMEPDRLENTVYRFLAPDGRRLLVLALEWGVRDRVLEWANRVMGRPENQDVTAVLLCHAYLYHDNTWYDWESKGASQAGNPHSYGTASTGDTNDGRQIWQKLVRRHKAFQLVLCGHVSGSIEERYALGDKSEVGYLRSVGDQGNVVHQLLFNAQRRGDSGEGWLRLLEFQPDGQSVIIKTFSPWLQQRKLASWRSDEDDYFHIQLTPTVR